MIAIWIPKYSVDIEDPCCYPLGVMYISSVLKRAGFPVTVYNNNLDACDSAVLSKFEVVLFTGFAETMPANIEIATKLREQGVRTILGGAYATFNTHDAEPHFDAIVVGEGEKAVFTALMLDGVHQSPEVDIDRIPWPDYFGININEYHRRHTVRYMGVLASRGCPHSCTFCSSVCRYRTRSLSAVKNEISFYKSVYDIDTVVVNDNTLNATPHRLADFSQMMMPMGLRWSAALRMDNLDRESLVMAKRSGLCYTVVGVESFDQSKLDGYNKRITVEQVRTGLGLLMELEINYTGNILVETEEEFYDAIPDAHKYWLYPTGMKKFAGNATQDAPPRVHDLCRDYSVKRSRTYGA